MHTHSLLPLLAIASILLPPTLATTNLTTSTTGSCGLSSNLTCLSSQWGNCCSPSSFCGSNATYCGAGCQTAFGACYLNSTRISPAEDGSCGAASEKKYTCLGSVFGNCCSGSGFCGGNSTYCAAGCQGGYGVCGVSEAAGVSVATTVGAVATSTTSAIAKGAETGGLSGGAKAGIGVGVAVVVLLGIGLGAFCVRRRRKGRTVNTPYQAEMASDGTGRYEKQLHEAKTGPSEIGTEGATRGHAVELPTASSHAELPAGGMTERERIAIVDDRAAAGYDGAYRGN